MFTSKLRTIRKIAGYGSGRGFSLVEIMVATFIFLFMMAGIIAVFYVGQDTWQQTETSIELQQDIRRITSRIFKELHESGKSWIGAGEALANCYDLSIPLPHYNYTYDRFRIEPGINGTDKILFQVPVDYYNNNVVTHSVTNSICGCPENDCGEIIQWGAYERWADRNPLSDGPFVQGNPDNGTCQYIGWEIEYAVNANGQLARSVFDEDGDLGKSDIFASNVVGFQAEEYSVNTASHLVFIRITITVQKETLWGRPITATLSSDVLLRNKG